jgi:hypothetical protein
MDESPEKFEGPVFPCTELVSEYFKEICVRLPIAGGGAHNEIFLTLNWFEMKLDVVAVKDMNGTHILPS